MNLSPHPASLVDCLADVHDPRLDRCRRHKLIDLLVIAVCAMLCGAEGFTEMEEFGLARREWLARFLELPNGIPSHDTFGRVFALLDPAEFAKAFARWIEGVRQKLSGEVVPIDGKKVRRSYDTAAGQEMIEVVSAWASEQRLTLGQVKVKEGTNEIKAVPELLQMLDLAGCIVTVDALNTQKEIASLIRAQGADYVLALKGNHGRLQAEVAAVFEAIKGERTYGYQVTQDGTLDKGHGRIEERRCWQAQVPAERFSEGGEWRDLRSVAMIEALREEGGKVERKVRYYISSLGVDAERMNQIIRTHWSIENSCHWILDVVFGEDNSRVRVGHAAQNLALVRKFALGMLSRERSCKRGVKTKRLKAALEIEYLVKVLLN